MQSEWAHSEPIVRRAEDRDVLAIAEVAAATFAMACAPDVPPEAVTEHISQVLTTTRFAEYLADPAVALFVADADNLVVGYSMVVLGEPEDPVARRAVAGRPAAELSKVYLLEVLHGTGVAARLAQAALDAAEAMGAGTVWLSVQEDNVRAQRFYTKVGFARVGGQEFRVGDRVERDFVFAVHLR